MAVTIEEIKHIANLAKLKFTDAELAKFASEFNNILDYISQIKECDASDIEFEHHLNNFAGNVLQPDEIKPSLPQAKVLQNATDGRTKNGYIRTSKIVSKE
ncbi:Glutamyl-tRNA(Gln) amidotransferase subunit C [uncultured bacterium]|nr:Asp-tRNA(Asn)/Glu-tRNA(Gln) amidotransferase subunit GatC [Candidatus Dojkabacteria bacterium]CAG1771156.1 Glutamyl-tRNA(Gln) amidotransferase subunit C [uncultured bacterium]